MNPNRVSRELRKLPGNIRSSRLPGGTLVSAVLDRQLMGWSDRGGASRIFGDIWSEHCWEYLSNGARLFPESTYDHARATVVRLDNNPRIAIQAGRNKLPNPDFLVIHPEAHGAYSVRAVDAKFAVDRLRRTQVSPDSIRELIELPGSLALQEVQLRIEINGNNQLEYQPGLFLGPNSLLNNHFFHQLTTGETPRIPSDELQLVSVDAHVLFQRIEEYPLMQLMQSIDELTASTPESDLVLGMYYLRLASAARWFETQARMPLLTNEPPDPADVAQVVLAADQRIKAGESAYGLIEGWSAATERAIERQKLVQDAARLPVRMTEIRKMLARRNRGEDKKLIRKVRGILEQEFMHHLLSETGTIPADPGEPISEVVARVASISRSLETEMRRSAERIADQVASEEGIES